MKRLVYGLLLFSFTIMMVVAGSNLLTPASAVAAHDTIVLAPSNGIMGHAQLVPPTTTPTPNNRDVMGPSPTATCCTPTSAPPTVTPTGTLPAPIIVVSPTSIVETHANPPQQTYTNFTIANTGNAVLDWDLLKVGEGSAIVREGPCALPEDVPWLTVSPTSGTNSPGVSRPVELNFSSTTLSDGVYEATICIVSNDFTQSLIEFPVILNVGSPSAIRLTYIENSTLGINNLYLAGAGVLLIAVILRRK